MTKMSLRISRCPFDLSKYRAVYRDTVAVSGRMFADILALIARLRPAPAPA